MKRPKSSDITKKHAFLKERTTFLKRKNVVLEEMQKDFMDACGLKVMLMHADTEDLNIF